MDWKKENYKDFEKRFNKFIDKCLNDNQFKDGKLVFIPIRLALSEMLGTYTHHWRRDMLSRSVTDGELKLGLLNKLMDDQEFKLNNTMIREPNRAYVYTKMLDMYYKKWTENEDYALTEDEKTKDQIVINIGKTGKLNE